jgi:hypothetical protein
MLKRKDFLLILAALLFFYLILYFKNPSIFTYKFDKKLIDRYMHSQDIYERIEGRVFISDSDIYIATGYLYANGEDPTKYNFPHPPLIKYLFGFSTKLFGNPFYVQIIFSAVVFFFTYYLGLRIFKKRRIAFLSIVFLLFDPVVREATTNAFLDLGQTVFSLSYIVSVIFYPELWVLQGVLLGLFAASKFWSTAVIFVIFLYAYKKFILKEKLKIKNILKSLLLAFIIFSTTYLITFINKSGLFNIIFFQLKSLKLMLQHNSSNVVGGPLLLFLTGYFSSWWKGGEVVRSEVWSFLWPVSLVVVLYGLKKNYKKITGIVFALPLFYFITSITQVPFTRYFVIILPYIYLGLSWFSIDTFKKYKRVK